MIKSTCVATLVLIMTLVASETMASSPCLLSKSFVPKAGKTKDVEKLLSTIKIKSDTTVDVKKLTVNESSTAESNIICEHKGVEVCAISPETLDLVESKTISIFFDGKKLKDLTCTSKRPSEENLENFRNYIVANCPLVDKERADRLGPQFYEKVFNTCIPGSRVEIVRNGCYAPCGNLNWAPTSGTEQAEEAQPAKVERSISSKAVR